MERLTAAPLEALGPLAPEEEAAFVSYSLRPNLAAVGKRLKSKLRALDPSDLPGRALDVEAMTRSFVRVERQDAPPEVRRAIGLWVLGAALAHLLHRKGHRFDCAVGEEVVFRHRDAGASATLPDGSPSTIEPFKVLWDLSERKMTPTEWRLIPSRRYSLCP